MAAPLYSRDVLRLAMQLRSGDHLEKPDGVFEAHSKTCGSRIVAEVKVDEEGKILALALIANACALGQASAALLIGVATGRNAREVDQMRVAVEDMLKNKANLPDHLHAYAPLISAQSYAARHDAILLPFKAVSGAIQNATSMKVAV